MDDNIKIVLLTSLIGKIRQVLTEISEKTKIPLEELEKKYLQHAVDVCNQAK